MNAINTLADPATSAQATSVGTELMHQANEDCFAASAPGLVARGWSVFPQERSGRRMPGREGGRAIKWAQDHDLENRLPTERAVSRWCCENPTHNIALVCGPASGNVIAVDVDVLDEDVSGEIQGIAESVLGRTPYMRVGRAPKIALFYRYPEGDTVRSSSRMLADAEGKAGEHGLEILGSGKPITIAGTHHKTGSYFKWLTSDFHPLLDGPEKAPVVTSAQVQVFLDAVHARFPFAARVSDRLSSLDWSAADGGRVKTVTAPVDGDGKISDGREDLVFNLVRQIVTLNADAIRSAADDAAAKDQVAADIKAAVYTAFIDRAVCSGRWAATSGLLENEVSTRVGAAVAKVLDGSFFGGQERKFPFAAATPVAVPAAGEPAVAKSATAPVATTLVPFRVLGHDRGLYFFLGRGGQVLEFSAQKLTTVSGLLELAGLKYWAEEHPNSEGGISAQGAGNSLIEACIMAGIYSPDKIRGRGASFENGKSVLHLGDSVIVDGRAVAPEAVGGSYVYERAVRLPMDVGTRLTAADGQRLVDLCTALPLRDPEGQGRVLAGWLAVAVVCGALPWRTHCYMTGERGNGKSWAMDNVIRPCLGDMAIAAQSKTTEAGVRAALGADARPFLLDEFESQNNVDRHRVQQILDLFRAASAEGGAPIRKSTKDQREKTFSTRSCLLASSINLALTQAADESRFVVLDFVLGAPSVRETQFEKLRSLQSGLVGPGFAGRLLGRSLSLLPIIRESAETLAAAIARVHGSRRQGDTVGVPLAGYWSLTHETAITTAEAEQLIAQFAFVAEAATSAGSDPEWRRALDYVVQLPVRVQGGNGLTYDVLAGDLIVQLSLGGHGGADTGVPAETAKKALLNLGVRVDGGAGTGATVYLATSSTALQQAYDRTDWGKSWATTLCRAPDACKAAKPMKFGPLTSRAVAVPVDVVCPHA